MSRSLIVSAVLVSVLAIAGCASPNAPAMEFPIGSFHAWRADDEPMRLYPGDILSIEVPSAPELSGTAEIASDGRVAVPLVGSVRVADMTLDTATFRIRQALSRDVRDPRVIVRPTSFGSQKIFVGGEVEQPGLYDLPGQIGALEAVLMAGGFKESAGQRAVVVIRRAPGGGAMMRVTNLRAALTDPRAMDNEPLERFDIIYVPRSTISEVNLFMRQYVRDALPVNFGFYYDLRG